MTALFITRQDLIKNTPLNGNIDMDKILHFVKIAQEIHIQGIMGTKLYNKVSQDIIDGTLSGDYLNLVNQYVKPMTVQYSFLEFLPFAQFSVSNKGIFKKTSENAEVPTQSDIETMMEATRDIAQHYSKRFVDYMRHYAHELFPEYNTGVTKDEIRPQRDITFGGWNI
jgi:hypothetical protein